MNKFDKLFGNCVEEIENPFFERIGKKRIHAVAKTKDCVELSKTPFQEYTFLNMDEIPGKRMVLELKGIMFNYEKVKFLMKHFLGNTFEFFVYEKDGDGCGVFKFDEEHCIILAPVILKKKFEKYEDNDEILEWNSVFGFIADDMVL